MTFGENLRSIRKQKGITQTDLADRMGVLQKDISRWENGQRTPTLHFLRELCIVLDISADVLLDIKELNTDSLREEKER